MLTQPPKSRLKKYLHENGLSLVVLVLVIITLAGQIFTGWNEWNDELKDLGLAQLGLSEYLGSGHFLEATFENWESEFLQMGLFVILTVWLRQKGSAESKKTYEKEEVDEVGVNAMAMAPWPVRKGGMWFTLYKNSLSLAFFVLFLASFVLHAQGGAEVFTIEQNEKGLPGLNLWQYMATSRFWFESFQNWQSEFVSIISIVVLSVYLRQKGSKESKPVDMAHSDME